MLAVAPAARSDDCVCSTGEASSPERPPSNEPPLLPAPPCGDVPATRGDAPAAFATCGDPTGRTTRVPPMVPLPPAPPVGERTPLGVPAPPAAAAFPCRTGSRDAAGGASAGKGKPAGDSGLGCSLVLGAKAKAAGVPTCGTAGAGVGGAAAPRGVSACESSERLLSRLPGAEPAAPTGFGAARLDFFAGGGGGGGGNSSAGSSTPAPTDSTLRGNPPPVATTTELSTVMSRGSPAAPSMV